jgi:hypothetical protein
MEERLMQIGLADYADTARTAKRAGLGKTTLDKLRCTGGGPPYLKIGKRVLYHWPEVARWLASRVRHSTSENPAKAVLPPEA